MLRELISKPAAESIREAGGKSNPEKYNSIIASAIMIVMAIMNVGDRVWKPVRERRRDDYER